MTSRLQIARPVDHPAAWSAVACREDPDLFFSPTRLYARAAQTICAHCPMLRACAGYALSEPVRATDGVFGSVLMPPVGTRYDQAREEALEQLRAVAETGCPAPPAEGRRCRVEWDVAELQARVVELRDVEGLPWRQVAERAGCDRRTVRSAYDDYLAEISEEVA
jgi:hypothetical protein